MHLVSYLESEECRVGIWSPEDGTVIDLHRADSNLPTDMIEFIKLGEPGLEAAKQVSRGENVDAIRRFNDLQLVAPLPRPVRDIICVGKNYRAHAREFHKSGFDSSGDGTVTPSVPVFFTKATTSVIGPGANIPANRDPTETVDYEGELAVVIGCGGRNIDRTEVSKHIFGYTILNDVTSRSLQSKHQQWFIGKGIDGFCPMGPALVTADAVPDVRMLRLTTSVNGELRQDARVHDLIFDIPTLIETVSASVSLVPGDIIATGTPSGVGIGFDPPRYLKTGDVVTVTIDALGTLENPVT